MSGQIFQEVADIPEGERLDFHVKMLLESVEQVDVESSLEARKIVKSVPKWSVGNLCLARWSEDGSWYNARVDSVYHSSDVWSGEYLVTFTDYGNSEIVIESDMAANVESVPAEQLKFLDKDVQRSQAISLPEADLKKPLGIPARMSEKFVRGCEVIARRDDKTWHKAVIHEVVAPGILYVVKYGDNGQYSGVGFEDIVVEREEEHVGRGDGYAGHHQEMVLIQEGSSELLASWEDTNHQYEYNPPSECHHPVQPPLMSPDHGHYPTAHEVDVIDQSLHPSHQRDIGLSTGKHVTRLDSSRFTCNICDKEFSGRSNANKHVKSKHLMLRFCCEKCGKLFSSSQAVFKHQLTACQGKE